MDEKKEALRRAASESTIADSTLQDKLAELNSIKPRPYGTIHAVSLFDFHFNSLIITYSIHWSVIQCRFSSCSWSFSSS